MINSAQQSTPFGLKHSPQLLLQQRSASSLPIFCCCHEENIQDHHAAVHSQPRALKISIRRLKRKGSESHHQNQSHSKSKSKKTTNTNKISIKTLKKAHNNASKTDINDSSIQISPNPAFQPPAANPPDSPPPKEPNRRVNNIQTNNIIVGKCVIEVDNPLPLLEKNDQDNSNIEEEFNNIFGENNESKGVDMPVDLHGLALFEKNKNNCNHKPDISPLANFSFGHRQINLLKEKYMSFPSLPLKEAKNNPDSDHSKKSQRWSQGQLAMNSYEPSLQISLQPSIQEELKAPDRQKGQEFVRSPFREQYLNKLGSNRIYKSQSEQSKQSLVIETYSTIANRKINPHKIKALA